MTVPVAPPTTRRWWVLLALCLSVLLVSVDNTIVNVALPTIGRELAASTSDLQWVVDGYTLAFAALLLLGGALGDRFGRRRLLETGLVLFAATSVVAATADTTAQLVLGRVAMGVSAAAVYPATLALLVSTFPDRRERATAIGIWSAVTGLSVAIGPVSGGLLLEHFAWGSVFLVNLPLAAVAVVAGRVLLTESADPRPRHFDLVGAAASVVGTGLLVLTTIEAPGWGWVSPATVVGYLGAALALTSFVTWELRSPAPLLDVRLFTDRRVSVGSGAIALAFFSLFGFIFLITQYLQAVRGYDTLTAGLATLPFALVIAPVSPLAILAVRAVGTKLVVAAGLLTMAAGFAVAAGSSLESAYWGRIVVSMVLMAAGPRPGHRPGDGGGDGRTAQRGGRRGVGRQRHGPRGRRHARRRRRRLGAQHGLRPRGGRRAHRCRRPRSGRRAGRRLGVRRARGGRVAAGRCRARRPAVVPGRGGRRLLGLRRRLGRRRPHGAGPAPGPPPHRRPDAGPGARSGGRLTAPDVVPPHRHPSPCTDAGAGGTDGVSRGGRRARGPGAGWTGRGR